MVKIIVEEDFIDSKRVRQRESRLVKNLFFKKTLFLTLLSNYGNIIGIKNEILKDYLDKNKTFIQSNGELKSKRILQLLFAILD